MAMRPLTGDDPAHVGGYRLSAVLGTGGMGRVYLAFTPGGRPVAVKVVRPELGADDEFRARFTREIEAARRVPALYTAQVLDADPDAVPPWVVTAYLPGPSLAESVTEHGPMPAGTVFLLMAGIAEALAGIHAAGVIHRDLKPSNILLAPDGPRVIDFGVARALAATMMTKSGAIIGSTPFMAPEQAAGQPVTAATDVFALGSLAAYAATGRMPFGGESDAVVLYRVVHQPPDTGGCPEPLRGLIERCLAKDPAGRPDPAEIIRTGQAQLAEPAPATAHDWLAPGVAAFMPTPAAATPPTAALTIPPVPPVPRIPAGRPAEPPAPGQKDRPRPGPVRQLRLVPRTIALLGAAAVLLIAATFGVSAAVLSSSRQPSQHKHATDANAPTRAQHRSGQPSATSGRSPTPSPSTPPSPAECLIGRWIGTSENLTGTINNNSVIYTGPGPIETYSADGTATTTYHDRKYSTTVDGNQWTQVVNGGATFHYEIQNGLILFSNIKDHGTSTLLENGSYDNGGPFTIVATPERFSCSGNTLREYPSNGSVVSTRAPVKLEGQSTGS
jgi:serine/threonine protein kinase